MRKSLKSFSLIHWLAIIGSTIANPNAEWRDGEYFRLFSVRAEDCRGEVRYAPPTDYLGDELWNITMIVQHKLQNFNPQQVKLVVRNITEFDSTFVMEPYDQDRILKDGKIAKFGFQGMFDPRLEQNEEGLYDAPHIKLIWLMDTVNETTIFDSDIGFVETTPAPTQPSSGESTENKIPTISLIGGNETEVEAEVGPTEKPFGWSAPEPDYVKFELPFNSPYASKFQGFDFNYGEALKKSIIFYEGQRSGVLPENNRIPWRSDSFILDRGPMQEDLSKGYFDAGDHLKFTFPMAFSMTMLSWSMLHYWDAYEAIGELDNAVEQIKWGAEWLARANPRKNELFALVGNPKVDHDYWGRPENFTAHRPTFKVTTGSPGSDVAGEVAAAMAAASLVLRKWGDESSFPDNLMKRAELLYLFADENRRHYHLSIPAVTKHYKSSGYKDELVWSAAWVYRATGNDLYLKQAMKGYSTFGLKNSPLGMRFSWDDKTVGVSVLLAQITESPIRDQYLESAEKYCNDIQSNKKVLYTPMGLVFLDEWGPIRYAMNSAAACLMVSDLTTDHYAAKRFHKWSQNQVDYVLGAKSNGYSYMVGYGTKYPRRPHHRAASCPVDMSKVCDYSYAMKKDDNPTVHWGAIVGGPDRHDGFKDDRLYYKQSEVALDFNAGFQTAASGVLYHLLIGASRETYSYGSSTEEEPTTTEQPYTTTFTSTNTEDESSFLRTIPSALLFIVLLLL